MKIEPSSDHRQLAAIARQMHLALIEQGFTEEQALPITVGWFTMLSLASAINPDGPS